MTEYFLISREELDTIVSRHLTTKIEMAIRSRPAPSAPSHDYLLDMLVVKLSSKVTYWKNGNVRSKLGLTRDELYDCFEEYQRVVSMQPPSPCDNCKATIRNQMLDELKNAFRIADEDSCGSPWTKLQIIKLIDEYQESLRHEVPE